MMNLCRGPVKKNTKKRFPSMKLTLYILKKKPLQLKILKQQNLLLRETEIASPKRRLSRKEFLD